jgi:hypothetical protein
MFVNKVVLSVWNFPSFKFLAACQFASTTCILYTLKQTGRVSSPCLLPSCRAHGLLTA